MPANSLLQWLRSLCFHAASASSFNTTHKNYGALRNATLLIVLLCSLQSSAQDLTDPCNPPGFLIANASGFTSLNTPLILAMNETYTNAPGQDWIVETAIFAPPSDATTGNITQRFSVGSVDPDINYQSAGGCMILLDDFPANSSVNTASNATLCGLPPSCVNAINLQYYNNLNASLMSGRTGGFCGELLATPPAMCNGSYAWGSVKAVQYLNNTSLYNGNATCDMAAPLNSTEKAGWLIEDSAPVNSSTGDTLAAWRQRGRPIFVSIFNADKDEDLVGEFVCVAATSAAADLARGTKALGLMIAFWTVWAMGVAY